MAKHVPGVIAITMAFAGVASCDSGDDVATAGGGGGTAYCIRFTANGSCSCLNGPPSAGSGAEAVPNCDSPPSDAQCCYDVDENGETTSCDCLVPSCDDMSATSSSPSCTCEFSPRAVTGESVSSCTDTVCCAGPDHCSCEHVGSGSTVVCAGDSEKTSSCRLPTQRACGSKLSARSCAGLKWKAPRAGGGGSSSGCTSDSECSCGDCGRCSAGSCSCGYRGVSGACIF